MTFIYFGLYFLHIPCLFSFSTSTVQKSINSIKGFIIPYDFWFILSFGSFNHDILFVFFQSKSKSPYMSEPSLSPLIWHLQLVSDHITIKKNRAFETNMFVGNLSLKQYTIDLYRKKKTIVIRWYFPETKYSNSAIEILVTNPIYFVGAFVHTYVVLKMIKSKPKLYLCLIISFYFVRRCLIG